MDRYFRLELSRAGLDGWPGSGVNTARWWPASCRRATRWGWGGASCSPRTCASADCAQASAWAGVVSRNVSLTSAGALAWAWQLLFLVRDLQGAACGKPGCLQFRVAGVGLPGG